MFVLGYPRICSQLSAPGHITSVQEPSSARAFDGYTLMKDVTKKQPTSCCVGCSVTGDGYGVWCYGEWKRKSCLQILKSNFGSVGSSRGSSVGSSRGGSVGSSRGGSKISVNKPDPIDENPAMFFIALPFTNLNMTLMLSYRFNHFNIFNV